VTGLHERFSDVVARHPLPSRRADLLKSLPLRTDRFGLEPEIMARLAQFGARIYELPVSYSGRTYEEGEKIGWKDGVAAFWHILRANLLAPRVPRLDGRPLQLPAPEAAPRQQPPGRPVPPQFAGLADERGR
jgi:hypothetical protein